MGIITKIEEKLGNIVERPFRETDDLDLLAIEVCLKRLIELKRKNILGKVLIPTIITIILNTKKFEEYEVFLDNIKKTLIINLNDWIKEKGYEILEKMEINFKAENLENKIFEVFLSYKNNNNSSQLEFIVGELINVQTGEIFKIKRGFIRIGRAEDCEIRINDPTISRKHASLSFQNGKVIIEDLESKCGTWVNHQKIGKKILKHEDKIMVGNSEFIFICNSQYLI